MSSYLESSNLDYKLSWTQKDNSRGDTVILDNGGVNYRYLYGSGTSVGQVNAIWYATGTLNTGEQRQFDLFNLQRSIFGGVITTNLSGGTVKIIVIENLNTGINQNILFNTSGSNAFSSPFQTGAVYVNIAPESSFTLSNKFGYNVSATQRYFYLKDINYSGNSQYEIAILGTA